jgi:hypothetical protein
LSMGLAIWSIWNILIRFLRERRFCNDAAMQYKLPMRRQQASLAGCMQGSKTDR